LRVIAAHHPRISAQPIDQPTGVKMLTRADANRTRAWESMLLLGDARTIAAARLWRSAVRKVELLARDCDGHNDGWEAQVMAAVREVNEARDRFYLAARQSLAIGGEPEAQAPLLLADPPAPDQAKIIGHPAADETQHKAIPEALSGT
jgi:hypothetical protein